MFELEDMNAGFHDIYLNKISDPLAPILDMYISDSMQEMLDIDIKSEVATVLGGTNEFTSLMNFDLPSLDFDTNNNNSSFNDDTASSSSDDGHHAKHRQSTDCVWLGETKWSDKSFLYGSSHKPYGGSGSGSSANGGSFTLSADFLENALNASSHSLQGAIGQCVNPNSVMPANGGGTAATHFLSRVLKPYHNGGGGGSKALNRRGFNTNLNEISVNQTNSPCEKKSHLTFSPNTLRLPVGGKPQPQDENASSAVDHHNGSLLDSMDQMDNKVNLIRKNLTNDLMMVNNHHHQHTADDHHVYKKGAQNGGGNRIELAFGGLNGICYPTTTTHAANLKATHQTHSPVTVIKSKRIHQAAVAAHSLNSRVMMHKHNGYTTTSLTSSKSKQRPIPNEFPKPAYSYSCLIAMALKNSRSGSLPVSEIYNFMCEHFPYFKTAPNGWKNSVRHNLSLNKCFEKIEKPATVGGQRKGCLWAMNPTKVIKMDEEVQKWSRKDPGAIRRAMVYPDNLAALERGEMKHGHSGEEDDDEAEDEPDVGTVDRYNRLYGEEDSDLEEDEVDMDDPEDTDMDLMINSSQHLHYQQQMQRRRQLQQQQQRRRHHHQQLLHGDELEVDENGLVVHRGELQLADEDEGVNGVGDDEEMDGEEEEEDDEAEVEQLATVSDEELDLEMSGRLKKTQQRRYADAKSAWQQPQVIRSQQMRAKANNSPVVGGARQSVSVLKHKQQNGGGSSSLKQQKHAVQQQQLRQQQQLQRRPFRLDVNDDEVEDEMLEEDVNGHVMMVNGRRQVMGPGRNSSRADEVVVPLFDPLNNNANGIIQTTTTTAAVNGDLVVSDKFDIEVTDFYDEIDIVESSVHQSRNGGSGGGAFVPDAIDLLSHDVDEDDLDMGEAVSAVPTKRPRFDVNCSMKVVNQQQATSSSSSNRRKMTLVNRIL